MLLLLNLTLFTLPIFSAAAKCELNGSNDTFLEADVVISELWGRFKVLLLLNENGDPSFILEVRFPSDEQLIDKV